MSRGQVHNAQDTLAAAAAVQNETALRLMQAWDRLESRGARAAFARPALRPAPRPPAPETLLAQSVEKVLGILAVMINEAGADIAEMNGMLDIITSMDETFFLFAGKDPAELKKRLPAWLFEMIMLRCAEKTA